MFSATKLKELFGKVAEVLTGKPTPSLAIKRRKRREETESGFRMASPPVASHLPPPIAQAAAFLGDVLDWLNYMWNWNHAPPYEQLDQSAHTAQHYPSLHL